MSELLLLGVAHHLCNAFSMELIKCVFTSSRRGLRQSLASSLLGGVIKALYWYNLLKKTVENQL